MMVTVVVLRVSIRSRATLGFTRCLKFLDSTGFREGLGFKV